MDEYIKRDTVLRIVERRIDVSKDTKRLFEELISAPSADVAPVVHGHWVEVTDEVQDILKERPPYVILRAYKCSECGRYEAKLEPYCNCGAKMDGGTP